MQHNTLKKLALIVTIQTEEIAASTRKSFYTLCKGNLIPL